MIDTKWLSISSSMLDIRGKNIVVGASISKFTSVFYRPMWNHRTASIPSVLVVAATSLNNDGVDI